MRKIKWEYIGRRRKKKIVRGFYRKEWDGDKKASNVLNYSLGFTFIFLFNFFVNLDIIKGIFVILIKKNFKFFLIVLLKKKIKITLKRERVVVAIIIFISFLYPTPSPPPFISFIISPHYHTPPPPRFHHKIPITTTSLSLSTPPSPYYPPISLIPAPPLPPPATCLVPTNIKPPIFLTRSEFYFFWRIQIWNYIK